MVCLCCGWFWCLCWVLSSLDTALVLIVGGCVCWFGLFGCLPYGFGFVDFALCSYCLVTLLSLVVYVSFRVILGTLNALFGDFGVWLVLVLVLPVWSRFVDLGVVL